MARPILESVKSIGVNKFLNESDKTIDTRKFSDFKDSRKNIRFLDGELNNE